MNGETCSGVTTFLLKQEIDTGNIIFQEKVEIGEEMTAGELHDELMEKGADLLLKTVQAMEAGDYPLTDQWIAAGARSGTRSEDIQRRHENPLERETGNHL